MNGLSCYLMVGGQVTTERICVTQLYCVRRGTTSAVRVTVTDRYLSVAIVTCHGIVSRLSLSSSLVVACIVSLANYYQQTARPSVLTDTSETSRSKLRAASFFCR